MNTREAAEHYLNLVDEETERQVKALNQDALSLDDLWQRYGEELGLAATGEDPKEVGKKSFKRRLTSLRKAFCESNEIQAIMTDPALNAQIDLALVFAGKLLESRFGGVNIALVAVLVAKIGVFKLCQGDDF